MTQSIKAICKELQNAFNKQARPTGIKYRVTYRNGNIVVEHKVPEGKQAVADRLDAALVQMTRLHGLSIEPRNNKQLVGYDHKDPKMAYVYRDLNDGRLYRISGQGARLFFNQTVH